ncbi:hypothetical protein BCP78_0006 [Bacillus phage BCP78]|uniref:Uncharacterized protein n=2 Tax=Tsarbombavirus BCP78 TaxID=1985182 RepID=A0A2S0CSU8_9CAUD|nr:hypothetical protein BCP78_0006 [Bacillus phage BCP78]AEW47013.1 hypothetical protein BCP78_0006 [Bacillus phage BCP78]AQN32609.1 hypothetical protein BCP12_209 [Bacillus phage BCP12]
MNGVGSKQQPNLKAEFRDLVSNMINSNRTSHHTYTIHRLLSLGLLIDFTFHYIESDQKDWVRIELDLKQDGKVRFTINTESQYGQVEDEESKEVLVQFLEHFDVGYEKVQKRKGFIW